MLAGTMDTINQSIDMTMLSISPKLRRRGPQQWYRFLKRGWTPSGFPWARSFPERSSSSSMPTTRSRRTSRPSRVRKPLGNALIRHTSYEPLQEKRMHLWCTMALHVKSRTSGRRQISHQPKCWMQKDRGQKVAEDEPHVFWIDGEPYQLQSWRQHRQDMTWRRR